MSIEMNFKRGLKHLEKEDAVLANLIKQFQLEPIIPHQDYYLELIESIISQQLSVKAAATIRKRFLDLFDNRVPMPEEIMAMTIDEIRGVGLSRQKATYIQDLAQKVKTGVLTFDRFDSLTNQEIIDELTCVKGIGEWTAHMFLIFCVARLNVLPTGDLGIKNGIKKLYHVSDVPTAEQITDIAKHNKWHPYESIAARLIWKSLDNEPNI